MDDNGYDPHNEDMIEKFNEWAERIVDRQLSNDLEYVPDTVGFLACLHYAARKVALRRDLLTVEMAKKIFSNVLEDICPDKAGKA